MPSKKLTPCVGYIRRSSAKEDSGSFDRQEKAIRSFAKRSGLKIVEDGFYRDGGVSGTKDLEDRAGLLALFERCQRDGIKTVAVENCSRISRELICQMVMIERFRTAGLTVLDCSGLEVSDIDDPQKKLIVQIIGALQEWDRSQIIAKMNAGRDRKRAKGGKAEGRYKFGTTTGEKLVIKRITTLRRSHGNAKGAPLKWTKVTRLINEEGLRNRSGGEFTPHFVRKLAKENGIK